jgi:hypothetical protein
VLRSELKVNDAFVGCKRAFIKCHQRRGETASQIQEASWRLQEKARIWEYQHELDRLKANIRERDDEALRRLYKVRISGGKDYAAPSKGPRQFSHLPREVQDTTYPRSHILYHGA